MPVASAMWASYDVGGYVYILCWLLYHACEPRASVIKDAEVWSRSTPNSSKPPERMRGPSMILWLRDSGTHYMSYMYIIHTQHMITYLPASFWSHWFSTWDIARLFTGGCGRMRPAFMIFHGWCILNPCSMRLVKPRFVPNGMISSEATSVWDG